MDSDAKWGIAIFGALIAVGIAVFTIAYRCSGVTKIVIIKEKWIKSVGDSAQIYLFSDTNGEVYKITDDWMFRRFDSANAWTKLTGGHAYTITFYGWRIPFLSEYQNAIFIEEIEDGGDETW